MKRQKGRPSDKPGVEQLTSPASGKSQSIPTPVMSQDQAANGMSGHLSASRNRGWLLGLLLVAATLIAYQPAWHGGFIWDDDKYVTQNRLLTAPDGLKRIWFSLDSPSQYFPLTYTTFRVERALWGYDPTGYHWVNLLLHVANALLVWRLLKRLGVPGAWLAAAIFALHPVQVESVAWITELKSVLSLFFCLLALLCWVEFVADRPGRPWRFYLPALIFYALALCSKTTACTLPAALFLVLWLQRQPINRSRLAQILPFLALGVGMGLLTVWWEHHQGTRGKSFSFSLPERLLIASHAVWFYAGKLAWPVHLTFSYPRWPINATNPLAYGWLAAGGGLCAAICLARRYAGRSIEVAALFYVATLTPLLGFFMLYTFLYTFVADHYQYVACIGPMALAAAGITIAFDSFGKAGPILKPAFCGSLLLLLGLLTWRQCGMYADIETLWRATIHQNPNCWMAYDNLGNVLLGKGQVDEAIIQFQKALEIHPDDAIAYNNLGNALVQKGRLDEAIVQHRKALEINPVYAEAAYNLGNALLQKGLVDEAIAQFRTAMKIYPGFADAHYSLGIALRQKGLVDEGIAQLRMALEIDPENAKVHNNLGTALLQKGLVDEGIAQLRMALEIDPDHVNAHCNLGIALLQKGQIDEAIVHFRKVVEIQPGFVRAQDYLGIALLQKGRMEEAVAHFQRALAIRPDDADACHNLTRVAWLLATGPAAAGRNGPRAVTLAEQADRLSGDKDPAIIGTLAAAYAEAGRFPEAIATARRAQQLAAQQGNAAGAEVLGRQVKLYQTGTPFRDTNAPAVSTSTTAP